MSEGTTHGIEYSHLRHLN